MEILKQKKYLGIVGNAIILLGLFLPLISVPSNIAGYSTAGIPTGSFITSGGTGILMLLCVAASLVVIFADKIPALAKLNNQKLTLIPTIILALIVIGNIMQASPVLALLSSVGAGLGIGVWICLIGIVACVVYPFLYKGE